MERAPDSPLAPTAASNRPRGSRHVSNLCVATAIAVVPIVQRILFFPPAAIVLVMRAAWATLLPDAHSRSRKPWWVYWARGAAILLGFLLAQWLIR